MHRSPNRSTRRLPGLLAVLIISVGPLSACDRFSSRPVDPPASPRPETGASPTTPPSGGAMPLAPSGTMPGGPPDSGSGNGNTKR
jgi:hypothetical protein